MYLLNLAMVIEYIFKDESMNTTPANFTANSIPAIKIEQTIGTNASGIDALVLLTPLAF